MNENYQWAQDNPPKPKTPFNWKRLRNTIVAAAAAIAVVIVVSTCYYTVDDKQQAVVTTFGRVTDVVDPGLHFKLPFGIQQARKVDVNVYQKIELGYASTDSDGYYQVNEK